MFVTEPTLLKEYR